MSETVVMPQRDDVERYVREVRVALADLPAEELDELTGGMEADLGELAAEAPEGLRARLGEPEAYAAELRSAAGLPPRPVADRQRWWRSFATQGRAAWESFGAASPVVPWMRDLAPVWWVVRGALLAWLPLALVLGLRPFSLGFLVLALPFVVASVAVGRRRDLDGRARRGVAFANVLAVLAIFPTLAMASSTGHADPVDPAPVEAYQLGGLVYDGEQVQNLYPYDADGNRLSGVRLFDDKGRSVSLDGWPYVTGDGPTWLHDVHGSAWTNIYPAPLDGDYRTTDPWSTEAPEDPNCPECAPTWWTPHLSVPPLVDKVPTSSATPSASATATASHPASPTATASSTVRATAAPTPSP